ncbi:MAG: M56 family metallopeptidase [Lachnospiraceae bacterium]|jgi:beta-lactamase regulating signal transducer with metallopeptidase domain|nr:M56 family metallopeptidase [Lachnospiraceae bacterium]
MVFDAFNSAITVNKYRISITSVVLIIWGTGVVIKALTVFLSYRKLRIILSSHNNLLDETDCDINRILSQVENLLNINRKITCVIRTNAELAPSIIGYFHPVILLPDEELSESELKYIIAHELNHLNNKDFLWKLFLELLHIFYWWNPAFILLKQEMGMLLEMRADTQSVHVFNKKQIIEYLECLLRIACLQNRKQANSFSSNFINLEPASIKRRAKFLLNQSNRLSVFQILGASLFLLLMMLSTCFIFEPSWKPQEEQDHEVFSIYADNSYLLHKDDNTYLLYIDGELIGEISDPNYGEFSDLPIYEYKKETR